MLTYSKLNDTVHVDKYDAENQTYGCWYYFLTFYDQMFPTFESFTEFVKSVATNHPDGMDAVHFAHLAQSYASSLIINDLIKEGLLSEVYDEEGRPAYKIHIKGLTD